jgi:ABC-type Na+ efflux pump permease subunit
MTGGDRDPLRSPEEERPNAVLFLESLAAGSGAAAQGGAVLFHDSTSGLSQIARRRLEQRVPLLRDRLRNERALALGHDPAELDPLSVESEDLAPQSDRGALVLSMLLPMLLVFMTFLGAFFPAVDLTAGEKERGCAETTLLLPVPRAVVHQGKILAVGTTAVIATALNLIAIGFSARHLLSGLGHMADLEVRFPITALVAIAPFALLFAFFVSAVLTSVAGLASSFKEGQALLGPAQMLFILPAMGGTLPGLELTPALALVPVLDVVLAFKAILLGKPLYLEYAITAVALTVYAALAIGLAMRLLSRESLLFQGRSFPLTRLFRLLFSPGGVR